MSTPETLAADVFPFQSREHRVSGGVMRYVDEGPRDADPILCVHGNPTWGFHFRRVIERFADRHRVIAVDHLGCGRSDKPPRGEFGYRLADHRDNLASLVQSLDLRRIHLIAHDWGGAIGTSVAVAYPDRFAGVALMNTAAFPPPYVPRRIAACRWPVVGTPMVRGLNAFARAATFMTTARGPLPPDVKRGYLAPYDDWSNRVAVDAFVRDIPMHPSHPTHAVLAGLERDLSKLSDKPIALIWGMLDWCFRPECLRRFEVIWPHADVTRIDDAGHYAIEDAPEEVLGALGRWLR